MGMKAINSVFKQSLIFNRLLQSGAHMIQFDFFCKKELMYMAVMSVYLAKLFS